MTAAGDALATIDIAKEDMHFSAAHFTVFSARERENLHGHNFFVAATATGPVGADGLCFDYAMLKTRLRALCDSLDETVLLAARSPHLRIETDERHHAVYFADEQLVFLRRDATLLPLRNVTVEELAHWFMRSLTEDDALAGLPIDSLNVRVSSGPGQWAGVVWQSEAEVR